MSTQVMSSSPAPSSLPSSAMKAVRSCGEDYKGHPIVVISAANFPNPNEISYDQILASIQPQLERMTQREYVVVLFNHGMVYHPSWDWLKGAFTSLDEKYKKNLASLYLVHPALWQIVGLQMAGLLLGRGNPFYSKVNFIFRLSELEEHLPLPQLYVPPVVREYDLKYYGPRKPLLGALLAPPSTAQFGVPLSQLMGQGKGEGEGEGMPRVFSETTRYLREKGEGVDDLFTKSPLHHAVQECVDIYNRGRSPNLNNYDVYIASALLKRFLRDLPDSTVPQEFNYLVASLGRAEESKEKLSIVEEVFKALPDENRRLLTSLIVFLKEICEASQDPRAQLLNVAFAFGPNLVSPDLLLTNVGESHSLVRLMIENDSLFAPREAPSAKRAVAATTTFTQAKRRYEEMEKKSAKKASPSSSSTSTSTASSSSSSSSSSSASSASSPAKKERGFHDVLVWQHGPSYARVAHLALDVPPSPEVTSAMSKGPQAGEEQQEKEKKEEKEEKEKAKPKAKEQKRKEERKEERRETKERKEEKKPALEDVFSSSTSPASEVVPVSYADAAAQGAKLALKEKEEQFRRQREAMFEELKVKAGEISRQRKARGLDQPSPAPRPSGKRTAIPPAWLLQDMREHAEEERRRKEEEEREREREERRRKGEEKRARREAAKQARAEKQAREAREFNETYAPLKPEPKNVFGEASRPAWLELELEEEAAKRQTAAKMQLVLRYLLVRTSFRRAELDLAQEKQAARLSARLRDMENHQRNVERKRLAHERQEREREARRQKELETRARVREEQRRAEEAARERKKRRALEAEEAKKQREEAAKVREEELKQRRLQAAEREREERERVEEERREKARVRQEQVRVQHHREAKKDKFATYKASFCPAPSDLASQASHLRHVQVSAAASSSSSSASASASSPSRSSSTLSLGQVEEMMAALTLDLEPQDPAALNWTPGLDGRVAQEGKEILAVLGELSSNLEQGYRLQDRENSPAVSQPKNNQGKGGKGKNKGKGGSQLKQRLAGDDDLHTESSELRYVGAVDNMDSEGPIPAMPGKGVTKPSAPLRKLASSPSPSPSPSREQSELHTESSELRYVGAVDNMDSEGPIPAMPGKGVTKPTAPLRRLSVPSPAPSREQSELHTESSELRYVGAILDMETEGPTHHQLGAAKRSELSTKAEIDVKASRPAKPGRNQSPPQSQEKKQQQQGTAQPKSSAGLFTSADLTKKASELHPPRSSAGSMTSSGPGAPTAEAKTATVAAPKPRRAPISYADIAKRSIAVGDQ